MVKIGIIGIGNMGSSHAKNICAGKVPRAKLTAVCDINPQKYEAIKGDLGEGVVFYDNDDAFFANADIDAVVIATPHYDHPPLAIRSFEKGWHVMVEKPAGVYTKQVHEMNAAAQKSGKVFGIMYNQRTNPLYQKVRELVRGGALGEMKRFIWIITNWYRPQSYYDSSTWRATWKGEGGGVLLNQDPHQLDLWQWITGMPTRVRAFMKFGSHRNIEVEDDVTAYAEYANGATGLFVTATHETPGTNRLEISGDNGRIVVEDGTIVFNRNVVGETQFNAEWKGGFGSPECWECKVPVKGTATEHVGILNNFMEAIETGAALIAPGIEGINGLTISNGLHLSAWTDDWVELETLDQDRFYEILQEKIKQSTFVKAENDQVLDVRGTH